MSYTLLKEATVTARKQYECIWCGQKIEKGEAYIREASVYEGEMQDLKWHPDCKSDAQVYFNETGDSEFLPYEHNQR